MQGAATTCINFGDRQRAAPFDCGETQEQQRKERRATDCALFKPLRTKSLETLSLKGHVQEPCLPRLVPGSCLAPNERRLIRDVLPSMDFNAPVQHSSSDTVQLLNAVTHRLARPAFLSSITPSRLPSQAASDASLSPTRDEARLHPGPLSNHRHSHLSLAVTVEDAIEQADLVAPLIQEPCADGTSLSVDGRVTQRLEQGFVGARHAYAKMASERTFTTFSHGHQDLVLAVDFNYFGTRMVTASSDHRLKVWDKKDESWSLVESWKAHDAEITDVSASKCIFSPL